MYKRQVVVVTIIAQVREVVALKVVVVVPVVVEDQLKLVVLVELVGLEQPIKGTLVVLRTAIQVTILLEVAVVLVP